MSDVGYQPDPGHVVILGRADDMLNVGGIKISSIPLEEQIRQIGGIHDAVVLNTSDDARTDTRVAAVKPRDATDADRNAPSVAAILQRHSRQCRILTLPSPPWTETGKVRRQDVAAVIRRGAGA